MTHTENSNATKMAARLSPYNARTSMQVLELLIL